MAISKALTVDIIGDKKILKILDGLDRVIAKRMLVKSFKYGATPLVKEAKQLTPVGDRGILRRSIIKQSVKGKEATINVGPSKGKGAKNSAWYAHFVEFQTVKSGEQPFMRPAWDKTNKLVLERINDKIGEIVEKYFKRLVKK